MKQIFTVVLMALTIIACGNSQKRNTTEKTSINQDSSYEAWNKEAEKEIRLSPKYGNAVKNTAQKVADEELIKSYIDMAGSRRKASELLTRKGFEYLYAGNLRTAMYRFNQAWLLDSTDAIVYSGFAAVYYHFKDYNKAIDFLDQGLRINPKASTLITDKGTTYLTISQTSKSLLDVNKGLSLLKESYSIDPVNQSTLFKLSIYYFENNDCDLAVKYYRECLKLGGKPITQRYKDAIKDKCGV